MVLIDSILSGFCLPGCCTWSLAGSTSASPRPGCRDWPARRDGGAIRSAVRRKRKGSGNELAKTRSLTPRSRVPRVAQTISQEIQRQQSRSQRDAGKNNHPPVGADRVDLRRAFGDERAEARLRRLNPESEVDQKRFIQDDGGNRQRQVSQDDAVKMGKNGPKQQGRAP